MQVLTALRLPYQKKGRLLLRAVTQTQLMRRSCATTCNARAGKEEVVITDARSRNPRSRFSDERNYYSQPERLVVGSCSNCKAVCQLSGSGMSVLTDNLAATNNSRVDCLSVVSDRENS